VIDRKSSIDILATEAHRDELTALDLMPTHELVSLMASEGDRAAAAVAKASPQIERAVDAITKNMIGGGRLLYVGAGTPGRLGVLDAAECGPTFSTEPHQVQAVLAGGMNAFASSREGIEDDPVAGARDIGRRSVGADDSVVAISASGRTPYVLGAVRRARKAESLTVGIVSNPNTELAAEVDLPIEVLTGAEMINGSTRLKAGTAQKLVLNMISTITAVRLGKTYGNLMVDVVASNEKLRDRALRIVRKVTGCDEATARSALESAGGSAKVAILVVIDGIDAKLARARLQATGGFLRRAIETRP
jgi:N-acetylmuramic acid 6-phosphate etherase